MYWLICIGVMLLMVGAFWYSFNWGRRPAFIQREMVTFKENFDGAGLGFTFGYGHMKGHDYARILGWGYGLSLNEENIRTPFMWLCWTLSNGRIYFELSSDIKLTEQAIHTLKNSEWYNRIGERSHGVRITTPENWRDLCAKEVEPDRVIARLVCDKKMVMDYPLARLKEQIPSISEMKVEEYLFSQ